MNDNGIGQMASREQGMSEMSDAAQAILEAMLGREVPAAVMVGADLPDDMTMEALLTSQEHKRLPVIVPVGPGNVDAALADPAITGFVNAGAVVVFAFSSRDDAFRLAGILSGGGSA